MTQNPIPEYYYSESEWNRLGCGPLPPERNINLQQIRLYAELERQKPADDDNVIKGSD